MFSTQITPRPVFTTTYKFCVEVEKWLHFVVSRNQFDLCAQ